MSKFLWKTLLVGPAALGATLAISTSASAAEALVNTEALEEQALATSELSVDLEAAESLDLDAIELEAAPVELAQQTSTLEQIEEYNSESQAPLPQVTSITQFSDVQPTDWAYSALQSLVERYGCVAGYPDGTFRGNRAMTRYEAAALLNACLDRVLEVLPDGNVDLTEINRLLDEFQAELATLRGRVDSLEARTAELEANQFSTTTKLRGQIITFAGGTIDEDAAFAGQDQVQMGYRVRLNFDTSFTGEDRLRTRFQVRDVQGSDALQVSPATGRFSFGDDPTTNPAGADDSFILDDLYYEFPLGSRIFAKVGFNSQSGDDWVASTISPVDSASGGTLSDFGGPAQYDFAPGDLGAGLIFQLTDNISVDVGYSGEDSSPNDGAALFNGDYSAYGQITFLSDFIDAALTYANAFSDGGFFDDGVGIFAEPAGAGTPTEANVFGGQVNVKLGAVEVGGGIAYADLDRFAGNPDAEAWSWQGTLALPDFGGEGNLLGALVGMPLRLDNDDDESFLVEGFYKFQVTDNISVTPSVIWIQDPGPNDGLDDTIAGYVRTTFSF